MLFNLDVDPRSLPYQVVVRPDQYGDGSIAYIAECPELPGCKSHGRTPDEARTNLEAAKTDYFEALRAEGIAIPVPAVGAGLPNVTWEVNVGQLGRSIRTPFVVPEVSTSPAA